MKIPLERLNGWRKAVGFLTRNIWLMKDSRCTRLLQFMCSFFSFWNLFASLNFSKNFTSCLTFFSNLEIPWTFLSSLLFINSSKLCPKSIFSNKSFLRTSGGILSTEVIWKHIQVTLVYPLQCKRFNSIIDFYFYSMQSSILVSHLLLEFLLPFNDIHIPIFPVTLTELNRSWPHKLSIHFFDSFRKVTWILEADKSISNTRLRLISIYKNIWV